MIGVCATLIGLAKIMEPQIGASRVDEYSATASLFFLASAVASYTSMQKSQNRPPINAPWEASSRSR